MQVLVCVASERFIFDDKLSFKHTQIVFTFMLRGLRSDIGYWISVSWDIQESKMYLEIKHFEPETQDCLFAVLGCGIVDDLIFDTKLSFKHSEIVFISMLSWRSSVIED